VQNVGLRRGVGVSPLVALALCTAVLGGPDVNDASGKIPITTKSEEARQLYLKGRDLADKLRFTDGRRLYEEAVAKDPDFARAHFDLANTAPTNKAFFDALKKAVALAPKASEGERLMILGLEAGVKGDVAGQKTLYNKLVQAFPKDERALMLMGNFHFGQQDFAAAVVEYNKAAGANSAFSQPYNQLGYSYRFLGKFAEAERAFKKYIELIPADPNPYDSYAELLMKMGRFDESIESYKKALSFDRNFIASYIGIGNDSLFIGNGPAARKAYADLTAVARNNGERRQAMFWSALSYVHEGATDKALAEIDKMSALAKADGDMTALSGDANLAGNILLEAREADKALVKFRETVDLIGKADVPAEVKEAALRTSLYEEARVALAKHDVPGARMKAAEYDKAVIAAKSTSFDVRRGRELAGRIALEAKDHAAALSALAEASQQDPRVLYLTALALQGKGDLAKAKEVCARAANFNELNPNYTYVRGKAKALLTKL